MKIIAPTMRTVHFFLDLVFIAGPVETLSDCVHLRKLCKQKEKNSTIFLEVINLSNLHYIKPNTRRQ